MVASKVTKASKAAPAAAKSPKVVKNAKAVRAAKAAVTAVPAASPKVAAKAAKAEQAAAAAAEAAKAARPAADAPALETDLTKALRALLAVEKRRRMDAAEGAANLLESSHEPVYLHVDTHLMPAAQAKAATGARLAIPHPFLIPEHHDIVFVAQPNDVVRLQEAFDTAALKRGLPKIHVLSIADLGYKGKTAANLHGRSKLSDTTASTIRGASLILADARIVIHVPGLVGAKLLKGKGKQAVATQAKASKTKHVNASAKWPVSVKVAGHQPEAIVRRIAALVKTTVWSGIHPAPAAKGAHTVMPAGTCTVKIGETHQPVAELVANAATVGAAIAATVSASAVSTASKTSVKAKKWRNVALMGVKLAEGIVLPVYKTLPLAAVAQTEEEAA